MTGGHRGTTRGEPDKGYDVKAVEWRARTPTPGDYRLLARSKA